MSLETEIAELLKADDTLMSILLGNVWTDEEVGVEGIRRGEELATNDAFDTEGYLLPCVLIRQRGAVPVGNVRSHKKGGIFAAISQVVEIYFYQHRGHAMIDLAKERVFELLEGERLSNTYSLIFGFETAYIPDVGPIRNSTTLRQEWVTYRIRRK